MICLSDGLGTGVVVGAGHHNALEGHAQLFLDVRFSKGDRIPAAARQVQGVKQHRAFTVGKGDAGGIDGVENAGIDAVLRAGIALQRHLKIGGDVRSAEADLQAGGRSFF